MIIAFVLIYLIMAGTAFLLVLFIPSGGTKAGNVFSSALIGILWPCVILALIVWMIIKGA